MYLCASPQHLMYSLFFFFNDTATTEIYTLSLHDALPISGKHLTDPCQRLICLERCRLVTTHGEIGKLDLPLPPDERDRKSTRLNSSHGYISYAVFCLKKKKKKNILI